jgi:hypothetical protein
MQVPDLVAGRKVLLRRGVAYVTGDQLGSAAAAAFRTRLSKALVLAAGRWATEVAAAEAGRLAPVIASLATRCASPPFLPQYTAVLHAGCCCSALRHTLQYSSCVFDPACPSFA